MADPKKPRRIKKVETVRERAKKADIPAKPRRVRQVASTAGGGLRAVSCLGAKEYHPIKLPDNRVGRFLTKRRKFLPRYFREAWAELRQVTWPTRRETIKLTFAVLIFALVFGSLIAAVDYGLEKLFREVLLS